MLVEVAPPVVSFTFGLPDAAAAAALRSAAARSSRPSPRPTRRPVASAPGMDGLAVQSAHAGGHWGTFTPGAGARTRAPALRPGPPRCAWPLRLPVLAAGGGTGTVPAVLDAGAQAVGVGTLLLLAPEAGNHPAHRAGLVAATAADGDHEGVQRPSGRGLRNGSPRRTTTKAPLGYPALHYLPPDPPGRRRRRRTSTTSTSGPAPRSYTAPVQRPAGGDPAVVGRRLGRPSSGSCRGRRSPTIVLLLQVRVGEATVRPASDDGLATRALDARLHANTIPPRPRCGAGRATTRHLLLVAAARSEPEPTPLAAECVRDRPPPPQATSQRGTS